MNRLILSLVFALCITFSKSVMQAHIYYESSVFGTTSQPIGRFRFCDEVPNARNGRKFLTTERICWNRLDFSNIGSANAGFHWNSREPPAHNLRFPKIRYHITSEQKCDVVLPTAFCEPCPCQGHNLPIPHQIVS